MATSTSKRKRTNPERRNLNVCLDALFTSQPKSVKALFLFVAEFSRGNRRSRRWHPLVAFRVWHLACVFCAWSFIFAKPRGSALLRNTSIYRNGRIILFIGRQPRRGARAASVKRRRGQREVQGWHHRALFSSTARVLPRLGGTAARQRGSKQRHQ